MTATQRPRRMHGPAARPAPSPAPARPPLRIVRAGELSPAARVRRARALAVLAGLMTVLAVFGVVTAHVLLAQEQFRLGDLQAKAATEQARNEQLRLEVAQLQSPARVVSAAEQRLGMVPPSSVTYLVPGHAASSVNGAAARP
ncbi:MAG TPA: cell division protein FtsL [Acidimicrobiales bacterium]|nr:cell division protein FtsL [Acidimicrobiales bacterium]